MNKNFKYILFTLLFLFSISSVEVKAQEFSPSSAKPNMQYYNSSNTFGVISGNLDNQFFIANENQNIKPIRLRLGVTTNLNSSYTYNFKYHLKIVYAYDASNVNFWSLQKNINNGNYKLEVFSDGVFYNDSCIITNSKIVENVHDLDISCTLTDISTNTTNTYLAVGFNISSSGLNWNNISGYIPSSSNTYAIFSDFKSEYFDSSSGTIINQNQTIINQNQQTNDKLDNIEDTLSDNTSPDTSSLQNAVGWLPSGPVDKILTLPLNLLNNLQNNLSSTCSDLILPLPFINKDLTLPCVNKLYSKINGLDELLDFIGLVGGSLLLYYYLCNLYKHIENITDLQDDNGNWGGF